MAELRVKSTGTLKLFENDNTSSVTIASPASLGGDRTVTLPDGDVTLSTGTMPVLTGSTNNTVATVTGADALAGETNLTFDGTDLTLGTGNLVIGTSGKGIDFSATADGGGTMTSELLDDYEEGDWTVQDTDGGGSNQHGKYTKIGNLVTCFFYLTTGAISGGDIFYLTNLPFTVGGSDAYRGPVSIAYTNATNMILAGNVVENSTTAYLLIGTGDIATDDEIGSSKVIAGSMIYRV